ncbi:MAG: hypothetical protein IPG33_13510 [Betaproteobacteria bacterium]|nr:hypothetical protein [Betaproteobacteria bacterium]
MKSNHYLLILSLACGLVGCSKEVDYREEVALENPSRIEVISRRDVFERGYGAHGSGWWRNRSELFLFGKRSPVWSDNLRPLYLERLPDNQGYLLVTGIDNTDVCLQRNRPTSFYVTFHISPVSAKEVTTPARLEGVSTNLLLSVENKRPANSEVFTLSEKAELTRLGGYSERMRKLLLTSKYGC